MYQITSRAPLVAPALIVAFDGWVSAGNAGTATADHIAADGVEIARFDPDLLYDYRVNRPILQFTEGVLDEVEWPGTVVRRKTLGGRDLLVMSGPEPNWHWQAFGEAAADLAAELGVVQQVSLGGIPWAAPHTRPTMVVTTSSRLDLLPEADHPEGVLRVPGSAASVVEKAVADRGIPTVGFWARVPHYVAGVYHPAVAALVDRVSRLLGIEIGTSDIEEESTAQRIQLDQALEEQPAVKQVVTQLEELYDASGDVATGEQIAAEIERYLRDRADGGEPG
ncbi:MAG: PAC2 family protein [Acidimicrobiia bacterium]|nr:MAG: PAC2 family protein [Acidimicrobiia bacterium]